MAKSTMLFDAMNNILVSKSMKTYEQHITDPNFKDFTKFMCLKYMTMSYDAKVRQIVLDNYMQLERLDDKLVYKWLLKNLPQQRSGFIKYIR